MKTINIAIFAALFVASNTAITITPMNAGTPRIRSLENQVTSCGSKGKLLSLRVSGCTHVPCKLKVREVVTIEADFQPATFYDHLDIDVLAGRGIFNIPFLSEKVVVPLDPQKIYTLRLPLFVPDDFGLGSVNIEIRASNNKIVELCGKASAILVK